MKYTKLLMLIAMVFLVAGCESEEGEGSGTTALSASDRGWHFSGRDCLACHNNDLGTEKHLVVAGTLYKDENVQDTDNVANTCNADLIINLTDAGGNIVYSSANYTDPDSKGYKGSGNIFLLDRLFGISLNGTYHVQIAERGTNRVLAVGMNHAFSGAEYSMQNPQDLSNRLSCNACHRIGGSEDPLYVQIPANLDVCQ